MDVRGRQINAKLQLMVFTVDGDVNLKTILSFSGLLMDL